MGGSSRIYNHAEAWNNHVTHLVGQHDPAVWRLKEALQMDNAEATSRILRQAVGNSSLKRQTKVAKQLNQRLRSLREAYARDASKHCQISQVLSLTQFMSLRKPGSNFTF
jgi:hypothetical protein